MDRKKIEELSTIVPDMRTEARDLRSQAAELEGRADNLDRIADGIEGLRGVKPHLPTDALPGIRDHSDDLRGIAAVRTVMGESPTRTWKARDVHRILEQRGWISPEAKHPLRGTEAAINRLWRAEEIERIGPGRYRYTSNAEEELDRA
jgi:hypothetical protein